jgi:hypothetical protein
MQQDTRASEGRRRRPLGVGTPGFDYRTATPDEVRRELRQRVMTMSDEDIREFWRRIASATALGDAA